QMSGAFGVLLATADRHPDASAVVDAAAHIDAGFTAIAHDAVLDRDAVPIGGIAGTGFGDHQHAPVSIEARGPRRGAGEGQQRHAQDYSGAGEDDGHSTHCRDSYAMIGKYRDVPERRGPDW